MRRLISSGSPFEAAGGYPEWLRVGEDMYLDHALVAAGARIELAPEAVVWWRIRPTLGSTWRQYAGYAEGDALAGMYPERHLLRFATCSAAARQPRRSPMMGLPTTRRAPRPRHQRLRPAPRAPLF